MINAGSGAGVYWNVGSSATIDVNTTFLGNILAADSITMNTSATNFCGRALAKSAAVTLDQNTLFGTCRGALMGSNGLSGGLDVTEDDGIVGVAFLPPSPTSNVPEPSTILIFGAGIAGMFFKRRKSSPV